MLVVDANVVAYLLVEGDQTARARAVWAMDREWHAPQLLFYELASVFSQLVRLGALSSEAATAGLMSAAGLVRVHDQHAAAPRILEISARLDLSAYDASYLAAAESLGAPLVTADRCLLQAAPEVARSLDSFDPTAPLR